jgi:hypothetical protein
VASRWEAIGPEIRFSGLVAALLAIHFAAETGRRQYPTTSTALTALAVSLTAPVGIAAAATLGQPWPICIVVGGVAALLSAEIQARRWNLIALTAASVPAWGLVATGVAAVTPITAPVLGVVGAVGALALGAPRRAVGLAIAVAVSPALRVLGAAGVGPGTVERIDITSDAASWSAPVAAVIAAIVIGVVAHRRDDRVLAVVAAAAAVPGLADVLTSGDPAAALLWSLPAVVALGFEALAVVGDRSVFGGLARRFAPATSGALALAALPLPLLAIVAGVFHEWDGTDLDRSLAVPLTLTALAVMAGAAGSWRRLEMWWFRDAALALGSLLALGASIVAGLPLIVAAAGALAGWVVVSAVTSWSTWSLVTVAHTSFATLAAGGAEMPPTWLQVAVFAAAGLATTVALTSDRREIVALTGLPFVVLITGRAVDWAIDSATDGSTLAIAAGMVVLAAVLRPSVSWPSIAIVIGAAASSLVDSGPSFLLATALALSALAMGAAGRRFGPLAYHAAGILAAAAGGVALGSTDLSADARSTVLALASVALVGVAMTDRRLNALTTASTATATMALIIAATGGSPWMVSLATMTLAAHGMLHSAIHRHPQLTAVSAAAFVGGAISLWWTTGTNGIVIDWLAPHGVTGQDLALGGVGLLLLVAGAGARRSATVSTWLAYSPGLGLLTTWLLTAQADPDGVWATAAALGVGVIAVASGGLRRLAAPLILGTFLLGGTVLISAGPRLAEAPTWSWIALGGVGLLVLAALVERSERPILPSGRTPDGETSLVEDFCESFE